MRQSGFTLLELSIVLVIIGLIIGGVTVGSELIRQAELQATIKEKDSYLVAINTFRLKYRGLPGDMNNISAYWPNCDSPASACNGDANGLINNYNSAPSNLNEWAMAWRVLGLSGMIQGEYDGKRYANYCVAGKNCPAGSLANSDWFLGTASFPYTLEMNASGTANALWLNANESTVQGTLSPGEAQSADQKIDDGKPSTGKVWTYNGDRTTSGCVSGTPVQYELNVTGNACGMIFFL